MLTVKITLFDDVTNEEITSAATASPALIETLAFQYADKIRIEDRKLETNF